MSDEELRKDVFAWYGSVAYAVQCFEVELVILLLAHERIVRPNLTPDQLNHLDDVLSRKTLGQLLGELKKRLTVHPDFDSLLAEYLKDRNYIAHRFFFENGTELLTPEGCYRLIEELQRLYSKFKGADEIAQHMSKKLRAISGVDENALREMARRQLEKRPV